VAYAEWEKAVHPEKLSGSAIIVAENSEYRLKIIYLLFG
jgi:hypothetical protein